MTETSQEAFDRGSDAGRIAQRLDGYDVHFKVINGSIADTAKELHVLVLAVQRLADQAVADAKERVTTAEAVEKARRDAASALESERAVRADRSTTAWTPFARILAALGGLAAILAVVAWFTRG